MRFVHLWSVLLVDWPSCKGVGCYEEKALYCTALLSNILTVLTCVVSGLSFSNLRAVLCNKRFDFVKQLVLMARGQAIPELLDLALETTCSIHYNDRV